MTHLAACSLLLPEGCIVQQDKVAYPAAIQAGLLGYSWKRTSCMADYMIGCIQA